MVVQQSLFESKVLAELPARQNSAVLRALEAFLSPDREMRAEGYEQLVSLDAVRRSPLAAAVLGSRLQESDLELRTRIVESLAAVVRPSPDEPKAPERVRSWLRQALAEMRQPEIFSLLKASLASPEHFDNVCQLLNACSYAGEALVRILNDRTVEVAVRSEAARAIAKVGFLEALPALENLSRRLVGRLESQLGMRFAPRPDPESEVLLPVVNAALDELEGRV